MPDSQLPWTPQTAQCFSRLAPQSLSLLVFTEMTLIIAIGVFFSFLLASDYAEATWTGSQGALVSVLAVGAAPVSLLGAIATVLRLPPSLDLLTRVLAMCLLAGAITLGVLTDYGEAFFALVFLFGAYLFFAVLRDIRSQVMSQYGPVLASLVSIALILLVPGVTGGFLLNQMVTEDSYFSVAFVMTQATFLAFVVYLWHKVNTSSFRPFLPQVVVVTKDLEESDARSKYRSLFVNSPQCMQLLRRSHLFLSASVFFVVLPLEVYLASLLYENWDDEPDLILFLQAAVPAALLLGFLYTSARYHKDEKVALASLVALPIFFGAVWRGEKLVSDKNTQELGYLVKYGIPATLFYWICMLYMYRHNKQCYQLVTPVLCYACFIPFLVIYPLYLQEDVSISTLAVLMGAGQLLGGFLFICFWLSETCATLTAHCRLLWRRLHYLQYYDSVQFLYISLWFGLSFLFVNQWERVTGEGERALLVVLIFLLYLALIVSLLLQQVALRPQGEPPATFGEVLLGTPPQTLEQEKLQKKKRAFKAVVYAAMYGLCAGGGLCTALYYKTAYAKYTYGSLLGGGLAILALAAIGLELKYKLQHFGERWMSGFLAVLWLFLFMPLLGVTPLLYWFDVDAAVILQFTSCVVFLVILAFITIVSIMLNSLFVALESEKLVKYCMAQLVSYLNSVAVAATEEVVRSLIAQFRKIGCNELVSLMKDKTYVAEFVLEDSDVYNKAILPAKESKRKETKSLSCAIHEQKTAVEGV